MNEFKYFSYEEFESSVTAREHGIDNRIPDDNVRKNIRNLVGAVLDPLRELIGMPIHVTSGYRCEELNRLVKGEKYSQHLKGEAADITTLDKYGNMVMVIELLCGHTFGDLWSELKAIDPQLAETVDYFDFDQLIIYRMTRDKMNFAWLHVSRKRNGKNRRDVKICDGVKKEKITLDLGAQNRLVTDLAEQVTLHDNTLKDNYKPSKIQLQ